MRPAYKFKFGCNTKKLIIFQSKEKRMKLYVGNLAYQVTEDQLREAFESFGQVESVAIIKDKYSGQSKGFGFVEMPANAEGQAAIDGLNGKDFNGRAIKVNEAKPRTEGSQGRGGGRRGSGGGGGGGGPRGGRGGRSGGSGSGGGGAGGGRPQGRGGRGGGQGF
jgi:RNA recognition motif-containing protein